MKRSYLSILFAFTLLMGAFDMSYANPARPTPFRSTQPDGTSLSLRVHGDEFLNWTTCNGRLVAYNSQDGYYYLATFQSDGTSLPGNVRVTAQHAAALAPLTPIAPPQEAVQRARARREQVGRALNLGNGVDLGARFGLPAGLAPRQVNTPQRASGHHAHLLILINFKDLAFRSETAQEDFTALLNEPGYSAFNATGSCRDYFYDNSSGLFDPSFVVLGPVTVSKDYEYYGKGGTENAYQALLEAMPLVKEAFDIDLSQFDYDGDGYIDDLFFYYAGCGSSAGGRASKAIWPHSWNIAHIAQTPIDGVKVGRYACAAEIDGDDFNNGPMASIGTFCHEFGHVLGLPDFYNTGNSEGGRTVGWFSLMDVGCYLNDEKTPPFLSAMEREILGWPNGLTELTKEGEYRLAPIDQLESYTTPTTNPGEFFIYENRQKKNWDAYLPGHGMLIFHVDQSNNIVGGMTAKLRWGQNNLNNVASHQCYDLVEAVYPESSVTYDSQCPFPGYSKNDSFTSTSLPAAVAWDGAPTGYNLTNITETNEIISFQLAIDRTLTVSGKVTGTKGEPLSGVTVTLEQLEETASAAAATFGPAMASGLRPSFAPARPQGAPGEVQTTTTNSQGNYTFEAEWGAYRLTFSHPRYHEYSVTFETAGASRVENPVMYQKTESVPYTLQLHDGFYATSLGFGLDQTNIIGVAVFDKATLEPYVGFSIDRIQFQVSGDSTADLTMGAVIFEEGEFLTSQALLKPAINTFTTVDVSRLDLHIPQDREMWFGYYVNNNKYSWPFAIDNSTYQEHSYICFDKEGEMFYVMEDSSAPNGGYNLLITVILRSVVNDPIGALGYYVILLPKASYADGDTFTLELNESAAAATSGEAPQSVSWKVNGTPQAHGTSLTLQSGTYTIEATLTFANRVETIVQTLNVP